MQGGQRRIISLVFCTTQGWGIRALCDITYSLFLNLERKVEPAEKTVLLILLLELRIAPGLWGIRALGDITESLDLQWKARRHAFKVTAGVFLFLRSFHQHLYHTGPSTLRLEAKYQTQPVNRRNEKVRCGAKCLHTKECRREDFNRGHMTPSCKYQQQIRIMIITSLFKYVHNTSCWCIFFFFFLN